MRETVAPPQTNAEETLISHAPPALRAVLRDALSRQGKGVRAEVARAACEAAGGRAEDAAEVARAVEWLHLGTLLVDDVFDDATLRRGAPAAHLTHGVRPALLAGAWLANRAARLLLPSHAPAGADLDDAAAVLDAFGALVDSESREADDIVTEDAWTDLASGKTASLFALAAEAGARRGTTDRDIHLALRAYGTYLGLAFQAADDLLADRDPTTTGKSSHREGANLARIVGRERAQAVADTHAEAAVQALAELPPTDARSRLETLARGAARRSR